MLIDLELLGLGAFLFAATVVGAQLMAKAHLRTPTAVTVGIVAVAGMGALVAWNVEGPGIEARLLCAGTSLAAGLAGGLGVTWAVLRSGLYRARGAGARAIMRSEGQLLGAGIAGISATLTGATGGRLLEASTLLFGYFGIWGLGWMVLSVAQRRLMMSSLLLVVSNVSAGVGIGVALGSALG